MTKGYRSKWTHLLGYKRFLSQMNPCSISETCSSPPPPLIQCFKEVFEYDIMTLSWREGGGGGEGGGKTWSYQNNLPQRNVTLTTQNFFNKCDSGWGLSSLFFFVIELASNWKSCCDETKTSKLFEKDLSLLGNITTKNKTIFWLTCVCSMCHLEMTRT